MRSSRTLLAAVLTGALGAAAAALPGEGAAQQRGEPVAFVNVNVLPMDREQVLEGYTVLVDGGRIRAVAPAHRVPIPEGTRQISGEGLYLLPGLAEMHTHLPGPGESPGLAEDFFFLYLANNITVVREMQGTPTHLGLRRQTASGRILGPTIFVGAPALDGSNARDPDGAEGIIQAHRASGYDFQKLLPGVPMESWDRLTKAAHQIGFSFGGHIPKEVGLRHALSTGISTVEHLDGYLQEVVSDEVRARMDRGEDVPLQETLESVAGRRIRAIAAHTRSSNTWVVPTLHVRENLLRPFDVDSVLALPEMRYVPEERREEWIRQKASQPVVAPDLAEALIQTRGRILRALQMAGVGVLMGTDSPQMFNVPGFSLRHEIQSMATAGLTPYEILLSGTRSVADYVKDELLRDGAFGTVDEGNRADLVLLRGNPLEDLEHLWNQEGVMVRGRWIPRAEIDEGLARLARKYGG
jgi:imidazolonepropionase-like amidohydrolase